MTQHSLAMSPGEYQRLMQEALIATPKPRSVPGSPHTPFSDLRKALVRTPPPDDSAAPAGQFQSPLSKSESEFLDSLPDEALDSDLVQYVENLKDEAA